MFFVSTHEFPDLAFGGPVDAVRDPESRLVVQLRGYGEFALQVFDPVLLIRQLTGTIDLADSAAVVHWRIGFSVKAQTPFVQVWPEPQSASAAQPLWHWPLTQD